MDCQQIFDSIIKVLTLCITLIFGCIGVNKLNKLLQHFKEKQIDSVWGFYSDLESFLCRFQCLIFSIKKSETEIYLPIKNVNKKVLALYVDCNSMSSLGSIDADVNEDFNCLLQECLQYISNKSNLVPLYNTKKENEEMNKQYKEFIAFLNYSHCMNLLGYAKFSSEEASRYLESKFTLFHDMIESIENRKENILTNMGIQKNGSKEILKEKLQEQSIATAKKAFAMNLTIEQIKQLTNLSHEEIEELVKQK